MDPSRGKDTERIAKVWFGFSPRFVVSDGGETKPSPLGETMLRQMRGGRRAAIPAEFTDGAECYAQPMLIPYELVPAEFRPLVDQPVVIPCLVEPGQDGGIAFDPGRTLGESAKVE